MIIMAPSVKDNKSGWKSYPGIKSDGLSLPKGKGYYSDKLFDCIKTVTGISKDELRKGKRTRQDVEARYIYWVLLKGLFPSMTLDELGGIFGRDHATVINAFKKSSEWLSYKPNGTVMEVGYHYKMKEVQKMFNEFIAT